MRLLLQNSSTQEVNPQPTDLQICLYRSRLLNRLTAEARAEFERLLDKFGGMEVLDGLRAIEECFDAESDL
jgi:hypothetical protein